MFEYRLECDLWLYEPSIGAFPDDYTGEYFDADSDAEALKFAESKVVGDDWTKWKKNVSTNSFERTLTTRRFENWMCVSRIG